jgi:D-alanyl-D-alanine carboxypeptidase (penicillin-binding protein 5/6)
MQIPHLFTFCAAATLLLLGWLAPAKAQAPAAAYVISDQTTGTVLDAVNPQKKLQIASLTKVASAMVVLDWAEATGTDLSQLATVPDTAATLGTTPGGVNLQPGMRCSLRDLLYASLMQSDNQAAQTLGDHVGRALQGERNSAPQQSFVAQMNALARRLGMLNTRFLNAHGLDTLERSLPYSTAEDLAKLTSYAMAKSAFRFYVSQQERKITLHLPEGEQTQFLLRNTNELLGTSAIDGVKTGTTRRAGECLILSAARAPESRKEGETHVITPRRVNVVLLGASDRFTVGAQLMQRGWQLHEEWAAQGRPPREIRKGRR